MRTSVAYDRASAAAVIGCFRWGVWAASLGLMTCLATGAMAQDTDDEWLRSYYNLERSHIDHPWGKGLIFEAQLAPQIVVAQGIHRLFADGTRGRRRRTSLGVVLLHLAHGAAAHDQHGVSARAHAVVLKMDQVVAR